MDKKIPKERLLLWLGLLALVSVWVFTTPQPKGTKPQASKSQEASRQDALDSNRARELILSRDLFQPLVVEKTEELPVDVFGPGLLPFPIITEPVDPPQPPAEPVSPLEGIVLRGVVEVDGSTLALLEGPNFPSAYLAPGQSQGRIKVEKLGEDWVELSAGRERKTLKLPGEFSVEPLGEKKGGGQN